MSHYSFSYSSKSTPQSEPAPGLEHKQALNNQGGYSFVIDDWKRLERFLILGTEGGTYHSSERTLTLENARTVTKLLRENPTKVVDCTVEISQSGRAIKNSPALFVMALASSEKFVTQKFDRLYAMKRVSEVCRTAAHWFEYTRSVTAQRSWGAMLKRCVASFYENTALADLCYQVVKYQSERRTEAHPKKCKLFNHRDLIWLSHPRLAKEDPKRQVFNWCFEREANLEGLDILQGFEESKKATSAKEVAKLIRKYKLPRECIMTQWFKSPEVWEALLDNSLPLNAMLRSLAQMTACGFLVPLGEHSRKVCSKLTDQEYIRKSRLHPFSILLALHTYKQGKGDKGSLTWNPDPNIVHALDNAFGLAFQNVSPSGRRFYLGCDVSGSMWGGRINRTNISAGYAAAAMSLITTRTEGFTYTAAFDTAMHPFTVHKGTSLDHLADMMRKLPWSGTDCALPMLDAAAKRIPVDVFVIYTDNETAHGRTHPFQALEQYRQKMGIPAKLVVVGMTATNFSIANQDDPGMLDVVGLDSNTPAAISEFAKQ